MTTPFRPIVRSQADVEAVWKHLMGPQTRERGFGGHSVWMLVIDADDRPFPQITQITEALEPPDAERVSSLAELIGGLAEPGRRFAFLRSRPGPGGVTDDDRAWARALYDAGHQAPVSLEVVHRACDHDLVALPMDDVLPAA
jgi:hypothetical protein